MNITINIIFESVVTKLYSVCELICWSMKLKPSQCYFRVFFFNIITWINQVNIKSITSILDRSILSFVTK
jgi:hypothetical protein